MSNKRANILSEEDILDSLDAIEQHSEQKERDTLFVLLTCRAGLRSQEVAKLYAEDVLDARGRLKDAIFVSRRAAKYGKPRSVPMRPDVREALTAYLARFEVEKGPLFFNQYGQETSANSVQKQLARIYASVGLKGCSSHSGRRTFGTSVAKKAAQFGGTLRDAQYLLGHSDVKTTEAYVDYSPRQRELVMAI